MPTPVVCLSGVTNTSDRFFVFGPAPYIIAISGTWNGSTAILERLLGDSRTWAPIATFAKDQTRGLRLQPGYHRLALDFASDPSDLLANAAAAVEALPSYSIVAGIPTVAALAADLTARVDAVRTACQNRQPGTASTDIIMALEAAIQLAGHPVVRSDVAANRLAQAATAAVQALGNLAAPSGLSFTVAPA